MREVARIRLGGVEHMLRPTWEAYADIEARTNFSIRSLWIRIAKGEATLRELAVIVAAGLKASDESGRTVSETKAMQLLFEDGPWEDETLAPISEYLELLGWTPEQRKKIMAAVKELEQATQITSANSSPSVPPSTD